MITITYTEEIILCFLERANPGGLNVVEISSLHCFQKKFFSSILL